MARGVLTLLTDFGRRDPWVAELTGAVLSAWARHPHSEPQPTLVDLTHDIPRGDIAAGSWFLERAAAAFPPGTVHLAVVDPGVGSQRPAVACTALGQCFVGPGNGLLAFLAAEPDLLVVRLEEMCGRGHPRTGLVSATFHGRDLFAPAAARLALGEPVALLGPADDAASLGLPPVAAAHGDPPRLVWIDAFGNAISDLAVETPAGRRLAAGAGLVVGDTVVPGPFPNYAAAPPGLAFWYWGSGGTVEIGVPGGSAAERLGLQRGLALKVIDP
ncbi:MAG: SAM-dependent chlorinase/fluorinase [bacterium]|nr:SAM-dependent chlorinase/fluorinase [bacterium]